MTIWKLNYNPKKNETELITFEVDDDFLTTSTTTHPMPKSNIVDYDNTCFLDEDNAKAGMEYENKNIANGTLEYRRCKDCHRFFTIGSREKEWFTNKELTLPKRCTECRKLKPKNQNKMNNRNNNQNHTK